jgi:hypothetical protein
MLTKSQIEYQPGLKDRFVSLNRDIAPIVAIAI